MLKFLISLIVVLIFLITGMLFLIPSGVVRKNIDIESGLPNQYYNINNNLLTPLLNTVSYNDPMVDSITQSIQSECQLMDNSCLVLKTFNTLYRDISYDNTQERVVKFPTGTIRTGQGSDKDLTVLAASVLTSLGVPNHLVYNGQTYHNMVCNTPSDKLYTSIVEDANSDELLNINLVLNRSEVWQANPEENIVGNYQIQTTSNAPITFAIFLNSDLMSSYLSNPSDTGLATCIESGENINITCTITSPRNTMAIIAGSRTTQVNFVMKNETLLLSDISIYNVKDSQCIPFDLSLREGYAYPGREDNQGRGLILMSVPETFITIQ